MTNTPAAIVVENLTKMFQDRTVVDQVSLTVDSGEVFAFLGPNGAGKTTTISMLTTLLRPTAGRALVAGYDVVREQQRVRQQIGIVFQESTLDKHLTAYENLEFHAVLYGIPAAQRRAHIQRALTLAELTEQAGDFVERFSGGMKRRLEIARALTHAPRVLFLDEPTLGLDPQTRRRMWDYIHHLRDEEGVTIFFTTHYMEEAEFADRIAIIDRGKMIALDTPARLKQQVGGDIITLRTPDLTGDAARLAQQFDVAVQIVQDEIRFEVAEGETFIPHFVRTFEGQVQAIGLRRPTLDDVFLKLTGHTIRDGEMDDRDVARDDWREAARS